MKMKPVTLEKIAEVTGGKYVGDKRRRGSKITSVTTDSREAKEGSLFVCIKGTRVDGHDFALQASNNGAFCRLSERELDDGFPYVLVESTLTALRDLAEYYRSLFAIPVIGIIGSVGKTTTKELTACVLSQEYNVLKTTANLNNEIGVPLTLLSMCEEHEVAVVEMGISDFGEMRRLAKMVRPDACIMTSIGYCHLEKLGDLRGVLSAKSEVYEYMAQDAVAIVNGDDELLLEFDPGIKKITYGLKQANDFHAEYIENLGFDGIACDICSKYFRIFSFIPAFGTHIVYAALAAAAAGKFLGVGSESIIRGLAEYHPTGGRANVSNNGYLTIINDCYNANPNSMLAALKSLGSIKGRRIAILGDMKELGPDSAELHEQIGKYVSGSTIDMLACCGKEAEHIYNGYVLAGGTKGKYYHTKEELFEKFKSNIFKGDIVLVKASHSMEFDKIVDWLGNIT